MSKNGLLRFGKRFETDTVARVSGAIELPTFPEKSRSNHDVSSPSFLPTGAAG